MALDLTSRANVVARLDEGLARWQADRADSQIRDGLIQRFEFTYDLSHKLLRRALAEAAANPEHDLPELVRTASKQGLLPSGWPQWRTWREMRNITSHTYDEAKALQVAEAIPGFLEEAREVLARLARHLPPDVAAWAFGRIIDAARIGVHPAP